MKFGVREICDVVLRAKSAVTIGNQSFSTDEPVIYFDSAKTSTAESAATTVYATGGRGASRLIAWEGEKTVTFTMEDALMSPLGFAILSGAGIVDASATEKINVHTTATVSATVTTGKVELDLTDAIPTSGSLAKTDAYAFLLENGEISKRLGKVTVVDADVTAKKVTFNVDAAAAADGSTVTVLVDFYVTMTSGAQEISITPDKFAGYYYLEASTLFRRQADGVDLPAQFIIPKVKIQTGFKFQMAGSGDPSTFTFTMDAFPDYTKFDKTRKVLFALQIVG
ncbi:MAG: hypothetical protein ACM3WQ_00750 [Chloroflexota bacterium]